MITRNYIRKNIITCYHGGELNFFSGILVKEDDIYCLFKLFGINILLKVYFLICVAISILELYRLTDQSKLRFRTIYKVFREVLLLQIDI